MREYGRNGTLGTDTCQLIRAGKEIPSARYRVRFLKPNPYTTQEQLLREDLPAGTYWTGWEERMEMYDLRPAVLTRDHYQCQRCGTTVTRHEAQVDHKRPVRRFKRPVEANTLGNLQTLCHGCHRAKTQSDRQMESRMRSKVHVRFGGGCDTKSYRYLLCRRATDITQCSTTGTLPGRAISAS
jgi:5-methylcytosine-specific restriction endonuclease McrA